MLDGEGGGECIFGEVYWYGVIIVIIGCVVVIGIFIFVIDFVVVSGVVFLELFGFFLQLVFWSGRGDVCCVVGDDFFSGLFVWYMVFVGVVDLVVYYL